MWKEVAVKPGEARRIGFGEVRSMWRRRVSRVVWKNFDRPLKIEIRHLYAAVFVVVVVVE